MNAVQCTYGINDESTDLTGNGLLGFTVLGLKKIF